MLRHRASGLPALNPCPGSPSQDQRTAQWSPEGVREFAAGMRAGRRRDVGERCEKLSGMGVMATAEPGSLALALAAALGWMRHGRA